MESNLKDEKSTIDDLEFHVVQFPARAASRLLHRLGKSILPSYFTLVGEIQRLRRADPETSVLALAPVLGDLLGSMTEDESDELLSKIFASTTVILEGKRVPLSHDGMIDRVFSGRLLTMYKAASFAIKVNYGDFIAAALGALAARTKADPASLSKSEMT